MMEPDFEAYQLDPVIRGLLSALRKIVSEERRLEEVFAVEWTENNDGSYSKLFEVLLSDSSTHRLLSSHSITAEEYFKRKLAGKI